MIYANEDNQPSRHQQTALKRCSCGYEPRSTIDLEEHIALMLQPHMREDEEAA